MAGEESQCLIKLERSSEAGSCSSLESQVKDFVLYSYSDDKHWRVLRREFLWSDSDFRKITLAAAWKIVGVGEARLAMKSPDRRLVEVRDEK